MINKQNRRLSLFLHIDDAAPPVCVTFCSPLHMKHRCAGRQLDTVASSILQPQRREYNISSLSRRLLEQKSEMAILFCSPPVPPWSFFYSLCLLVFVFFIFFSFFYLHTQVLYLRRPIILFLLFRSFIDLQFLLCLFPFPWSFFFYAVHPLFSFHIYLPLLVFSLVLLPDYYYPSPAAADEGIVMTLSLSSFGILRFVTLVVTALVLLVISRHLYLLPFNIVSPVSASFFSLYFFSRRL